jgi:hypothetical protein
LEKEPGQSGLFLPNTMQKKRLAVSAGRNDPIWYNIGLFGGGAAAVDGPGNVTVGGVERFQCCAAGEFDPFEAELTALFFLYPAYYAAVAPDACSAKSFHYCFPLLPFFDLFPFMG